MRLFIDDIRNAPDDTWTVARSVTAAIRTIAMFRDSITEISLDHDISHQVTVGGLSRPYPCEETFAAVAYYIGREHLLSTGTGVDDVPWWPKLTAHTSNPVGAETIEHILAKSGLTCEIKMTGLTANRLEMEV